MGVAAAALDALEQKNPDLAKRLRTGTNPSTRDLEI